MTIPDVQLHVFGGIPLVICQDRDVLLDRNQVENASLDDCGKAHVFLLHGLVLPEKVIISSETLDSFLGEVIVAESDNQS